MKRTSIKTTDNTQNKKYKASYFADTAAAASGRTQAAMQQDQDDPGGVLSSDMVTEEQSVAYAVPVKNRFAPLPIPIPEPPSLRVITPRAPQPPPPLHVFEAADKVRLGIPTNLHVVTRNRRSCIDVYPNTIEDHAELSRIFLSFGWKFHTHGATKELFKKFVLHDIHDTDISGIFEDLDAYGLRPENITKLPARNPKYAGQATYIVQFKRDSGITLDIIRQAKYICRTVARWSHYTSNGDGVIICSRCCTPGHMMKHCNRSAKCKVCSENHLTNDCPLIIAKRKLANPVPIHEAHLKCPLCSGRHTAGYRLCPGRQAYKSIKAAKRTLTKYIDAPTPTFNHWDRQTEQRITTNQPNNTREPADSRILRNHTIPSMNRSVPVINNNNSNNERFNPDELIDIFLNMIDIAEQYSNKADQLRALGKIIAQHVK